MRVVLFCANPYALALWNRLREALVRLQHTVLWYIPEKIASQFPFAGTFTITVSSKMFMHLKVMQSFVPGNEVPHYFRGVKGSRFSRPGRRKAKSFQNPQLFRLIPHTGSLLYRALWAACQKTSWFYRNGNRLEQAWPLYQNHGIVPAGARPDFSAKAQEKLILYAPTFSPSLTLPGNCAKEIFDLASQDDIYVMIKFHDLMDTQVVNGIKLLRNRLTMFRLLRPEYSQIPDHGRYDDQRYIVSCLWIWFYWTSLLSRYALQQRQSTGAIFPQRKVYRCG